MFFINVQAKNSNKIIFEIRVLKKRKIKCIVSPENIEFVKFI